ncbi:MAG: hypothetical protein ACRYGR_03585 [Janthinobacterium lividum]
MKNASYLTLAVLLLAGCETNSNHRTNWENDCKRNYSENSRDFAACKARMESNSAMKNFAKESGTVGVNPDNANLPATDETRKSHDA